MRSAMQRLRGQVRNRDAYACDGQILNPPRVGVEHAKAGDQEEDDDTNKRVDDGEERIGQRTSDEGGHDGPVECDGKLPHD